MRADGYGGSMPRPSINCQAFAPDPRRRLPEGGEMRGEQMSAHHDRVRAVVLVHGLEADRHSGFAEDGDTVTCLTARVTRIQARLDRTPSTGGRISDYVDSGTDADAWMLAVYDAALVELCAALSVGHSLVDDAVCPDRERQRVELELLSSVLPLG
jgi:hypothetical protein